MPNARRLEDLSQPRRSATWSAAALFELAAFSALAAGLIELPLLFVKRFVLHDFIFVGLHVFWMAPASYLMLFMPLALLLYAPARRFPRVLRPERLVFCFAFLGGWGALLVFRMDLHWVARFLLALGLAAQAARSFGSDSVRLRRIARWATIRLAAVVVFASAIVVGSLFWMEDRALANLPNPPRDAPHVFLFILDTVRAASTSVYDATVHTTPNLTRWVADRGAVFEWAVATSTWSLPSHAGLLTGRYPCEAGTDWMRPLDRTFPTLAQGLANRGYQTGGFVANTRYVTRETGIARGFARFDEFTVGSLNAILRHSSLGAAMANFAEHRLRIVEMNDLKRADRVNRELLQWLSGTSPHRPVFAMLNYMDAHQPFVPPKPFDTLFGAPRSRSLKERSVGRLRRFFGMPVELPPALQSNEDWADRQRRYYHGEIAYLDSELGRLFEELDRRNYLDNAIIIVTSDHGEDLAEQGSYGHGNHLYLQSTLRVPLLIAWPDRVPEGLRVTSPVSTRSIPATVLDLVSASAGGFPGLPLTRYWQPEPASGLDAIVYAEVTPMTWWWTEEVAKLKTLVVDSMQFIRTYDSNGSHKEELYNFHRDEWQRENLAVLPEHHATVRELGELLDVISETCVVHGMLPNSLSALQLLDTRHRQ